MSAPVLQIERLSVGYDGQPPLAQDWSFNLPAGVTLLHGDTGSGKSTLLRALAGTGPAPARGALTLNGTRLDRDPALWRRAVALFDPAADANGDLSAFDSARLQREADAGFDPTVWDDAADGFALAPHLDKPVFMLSTGSRRKVALAGALASGCPLVLLDEPTAALDLASVRHLWRLLVKRAARGQCAIVIASGQRIDALPLAATIVLPLLCR